MPGEEAEMQARLNRALADDDQDEVRRLEAGIDRLDAERLRRLTAPDALAQAARWYAANGIPVFPLRVGNKAPLLPKAHPDDDALQHTCQRACGRDGHGLYDATTDLGRVRDWWERTPQANIGLRTGEQYDVIDVDPPSGWDGLRRLRELGLVPPVLGYAHTPRGGLHLYIRPTGDGNSTDVAGLAGIDYRGAAGYVVAPPSRTGTGMWIWSTPINPTEIAP